MSREELESITPVTPPMVKRQINPNTQRRGVSIRTNGVPIIVASHLKTLIPVGIAIIIVAAVK